MVLPMSFDADSQQTFTDGVTPVDIVDAPPVGTRRVVTDISFFNASTTKRTLVAELNNGVNDFVFFNEELLEKIVAYWDGRIVLDSTKKLTAFLNSATAPEFEIVASFADET